VGCHIIVVKEGRRKRYIGFVVKQTAKQKTVFEKSEIIKEIKNGCKTLFDKDCKEMKIYLTRFDGEKGVIRCSHLEKENTIRLLKSIKKISNYNVKVDTLGTSGTIKALVSKHMNN